MVALFPFPGWLVHPDWAERVAAPMLDQVGPDELDRIVSSNPDSYLRVNRPADPGDDAGTALASNRSALDRLLAVGAYRRNEAPALYIYALRDGAYEQTGIVAEIPVEAFANREVLGHEAVQPERVDALARHMGAVPVRSELVALMDGTDEASDRTRSRTTEQAPTLEFVADGVTQRIWHVADPDPVAALREDAATGPLFITDGHHRVAAAIRLWEEAGRPEHHRVLCVVYPHQELRMLAFDRRVVGPLDAREVLAGLDAVARVEPVEGPVRARGAFGLYLAGRWYRLELRDVHPGPGVEGLDVTTLHRDLLGPVLRVGPGDDDRLEFVPQFVPLEEPVGACDRDSGALFVLHPPSLPQLKEVSMRGEVMPAKATYFHPKPLTGLILRLPD